MNTLTIHNTRLSLAQAAELLALAPDVPPVMTDDAVREAIGAVLDDHGGDVAACVADFAHEFGEHPDRIAARMIRTVVYTSRLPEVQV